MYEDIRKQFFPMRLPLDIVARSMDRKAAQESIKWKMRSRFSYERVLGATPGSLPIADEQTLAAWFKD